MRNFWRLKAKLTAARLVAVVFSVAGSSAGAFPDIWENETDSENRADEEDELAPPFEEESFATNNFGKSINGYTRLVSEGTINDRQGPPVSLQVIAGWNQLHAGLVLAYTRYRIAPAQYHSQWNSLVVPAPRNELHLPKFYMQYKTAQWSVIIGHFSAGFGQHLTLDNTGRRAAQGFFPDAKLNLYNDRLVSPYSMISISQRNSFYGEYANSTRVTADYHWQETFRGIAAQYHANFRWGKMHVSGFGSFQNRSLSQYQLVNRSLCRSLSFTGVDCPPVSVIMIKGSNSARLVRSNLPEIYREIVWGGNISVDFGKVLKTGITGYVAADQWNVSGVKLQFRKKALRPSGGKFGAMGIDGSWEWAKILWHWELAGSKSNDLTKGWGGNLGAYTKRWKNHELDYSLRYYSNNYINPLARPISSPQRYGGQRARNEAGIRGQYSGNSTQWKWLAEIDWSFEPHGTKFLPGARLLVDSGFSYSILANTYLAFGADYYNKGFYNDPNLDEDLDDAPKFFKRSFGVTSGVFSKPFQWPFHFSLEARTRLVEEYRSKKFCRQEIKFRGKYDLSIVKYLRLIGKIDFLDEDISTDAKMEKSIYGRNKLILTWAPWVPGQEVVILHDIWFYLDSRSSTLARDSWEQRLRIEWIMKW